LGVQAREKASDLFALAAHIHLLLMAGNHPFLRGEWTGAGEQPTALTLARSGFWAGGPSSPLRTHPLAPPITFLPEEIQQMFVRAFTHGAQNPRLRPTAAEWRAALSRIRTRPCEQGTHQVPVSCLRCPWCAIEAERATRKLRQAGGAGPAAPNTLSRSAPHGGYRSAPPGTVQDAGTDSGQPGQTILSTRVILVGLALFVMIVVALTTYIVWAILSGQTSFGAIGPALTKTYTVAAI
jgi:hypothetical protein